MINHYEWLEKNLPIFFKNIGLNFKYSSSLIRADGDKCYCYEHVWIQGGIPFPHGVALYLLANIPPFDAEVRQTVNGWIAPDKWVIENYNKFKEYLPKIEN